MRDMSATSKPSSASVSLEGFKMQREATMMPEDFERVRSSKTSASRRSKASLRDRRMRSSKSNYSANFDRNNIQVQIPRSDHVHSRDSGVSDRLTMSSEELEATSQNININQNIRPIFDIDMNEYESPYSIKTPENLQLRDIMIPLEDWGAHSKEVIQEKKYPVLPSIGKGSAGKSSVHGITKLEREVTLNQLDYGREKMEEEADFFADFRINTTSVQATPRQNPLPPIARHRVGSTKH